MSTGPTYTGTDVDPYDDPDFDYIHVDRGRIVEPERADGATAIAYVALILFLGLMFWAPTWPS